MHIAIDGRLLAYHLAGISQYTRHLVRALGWCGGDERLTLLVSGRHPKPNIENDRLRYAPMFTPPHHRWEQLALPIELLRVRPTILHSPDFVPPLHWPGRRVITVHDLAFMLYPDTVTPESASFYSQIQRAVHEVDAVIVPSATTGRDLLKLMNPDPSRVHVIPNGVDPDFRRVDDQTVLAHWRDRFDVDKPFVLFAGTFEPRKNIPLLLDAFAQLRERQNVLLVLLGARGWLFEPIFERIGSLGITDQVRVIETLPREEWVTAISAASVLVLPSLYEGFGLPAIEAMVCGTPVVSSDAGALPEVIGEAGMLFPSGEADALAIALERVLDDTEYADHLRSLGYERATQFSWAKSAAQTLDVYREVAQA